MHRILCNLYFSVMTIGAISSTIFTAHADSIKWEDDKPEVKIKASGRFSKQRVPKLQNSKLAPSGTTANILAVDNYRFNWKPSWSFVGMGGTLLPFVSQSLDQSTLGIVENLPQKDAPASSIVVFLNLYNFEVINYTVLPGKDVRRFCYVPNSSKIVCLVKQPFDKYYPTPKYQLLTIDTRDGEISSISPVFKDNITALCCSSDGNRLFATIKNSDQLRIYAIDDLEQKFSTFKAVKNPIALSNSIDGRRLVVTGSEKIQIIDASTEELIMEKSIKLPEYYHPDKTILCSDDASTMLVSKMGDNTYYYNGMNFISLSKRTDVDVAWWEAGKRILVGEPKKSRILFYKASDLGGPKSEFNLQRTRPKTTGKLRKIVCLPSKKEGVAILDSMGNLCYFTKARRRWQKEIIINQPSPQ